MALANSFGSVKSSGKVGSEHTDLVSLIRAPFTLNLKAQDQEMCKAAPCTEECTSNSELVLQFLPSFRLFIKDVSKWRDQHATATYAP